MVNSYTPPESAKFIQRKSFLNYKMIIALVAIPLLVGCVNMSGSKIQSSGTEKKMMAGLVLNQEVSAFLASAAPLAASEFAATLWGENVLLQTGEPYFSASGRNCRKITVLDTGRNESLQLACEFGDGLWESVRLVTQLLGTR